MSALFCPNTVAWGDVATWFAGAGAVIVAALSLYFSNNAERARKKERVEDSRVRDQARERDAQIFATAIHPELGRLSLLTAEHRRALMGTEQIDWRGFADSLRFAKLPVIEGSLEKIWQLDSDTARFVSSARSSLLQLQNLMDRYTGREALLQGDAENLLVLHADLQKFANGAYTNACLVAGASGGQAALPESTRLTDYETRLLEWINHGAAPKLKPRKTPGDGGRLP
jgi:hypothetical protein